VFASGLGRLLAGVALVDVGEIDGVTGGSLHGLRPTSDLGAVVGIGGGDVQGQEMAKRIDGQLDLRVFLALGAIVASSLATLGRGSQGLAVEDGRTRLWTAARFPAEPSHHVLNQGSPQI
jgi:hypothetical protein